MFTLLDVIMVRQDLSFILYIGVCGRRGKCHNLEDGSGYKCSCPLGITGRQCSQGIRKVFCADISINPKLFMEPVSVALGPVHSC